MIEGSISSAKAIGIGRAIARGPFCPRQHRGLKVSIKPGTAHGGKPAARQRGQDPVLIAPRLAPTVVQHDEPRSRPSDARLGAHASRSGDVSR
jgi:hypothetical protein